MELLKLPTELIEHILTELHPMNICRQLHLLIDTSIELRLRIELAYDGFLLGYRGDLPATELLELVLERRRAFEGLRPQSHWSLPFPITGDKKFEVADGIWGYSRYNQPDTTFRSLKFEEMLPPDGLRGRWELDREELGFNATDLSFWLDADALFLIENRDEGAVWRIHFRELSTNETHPLAFQPFLDIFKKDHEVWEQCEIVSHEERLSVEFFDVRRNGATRLAVTIFDWTTGEMLLPYTVTSDLAFLTKDLIVLTQSVGSEEKPKVLEVRSLGDGDTIYRCEMPLLFAPFHLRFLKRPASYHVANCPTRFDKIFLPDPLLSILGIVFHLSADPTQTFTVVMAIHPFLRRCRHLADAARVDASDTEQEYNRVPLFEWEDWGPTVTRWLPLNVHGEYGSRMLYGSRLLAILFTLDSMRMLAMLLDFNPRPIRRGSSAIDGKEYSVSTVDQETQWDDYAFPVSSALPYRVFTSQRNHIYLNLFLDSNTIVGRLENEYHFFSFISGPHTKGGETPLRML